MTYRHLPLSLINLIFLAATPSAASAFPTPLVAITRVRFFVILLPAFAGMMTAEILQAGKHYNMTYLTW